MLLDQGWQEGEAQGEARGRALGEATVTLRQLNRRWSSWKSLPRRCWISAARPIWRRGWLRTPAERRAQGGLQAVRGL
jgi:hypothetical protein